MSHNLGIALVRPWVVDLRCEAHEYHRAGVLTSVAPVSAPLTSSHRRWPASSSLATRR
jgi:hypothetical protein